MNDQTQALSSDQLSFAVGSELTRSMQCLSPGQDLLEGHEQSTPTFIIKQVGRCFRVITDLAIPLELRFNTGNGLLHALPFNLTSFVFRIKNELFQTFLYALSSDFTSFASESTTIRSNHCLGTVWSLFKGHERPAPCMPSDLSCVVEGSRTTLSKNCL
jgi:hypothetical protein